ncbi:MAG TPA: ATP-binding protein [Acidimicrobiales bacterium]|nr:ATP-binding protein [Acidimicrobiales bacterium]
MKPPARALVGNLIWSTDGGVWALWRVAPFAHAHTSAADKVGVHTRLRGMLISLPVESMLLSVCERLDEWDVVANMLEDVDVDRHPAWAEVCRATAESLSDMPLHRRVYYVAASLDGGSRQGQWRDALKAAAEDVASGFGLSPMPVSARDLDTRRSQARALEVRLGAHVKLTRATAGEIRWLYARTLRRGGPDEPVLDEGWEPPTRPAGAGRVSVLAPLTDAVVKEGGYRDDADRPRHRRYVRVDAGDTTTYQTCLAVADMPHEFTFPGGGGEWLYHVDDVGFPIDWCVRVRSVPNAESQLKVRRQHRQLIGQVDEYDVEMTGAPPSLAEAIAAVDGQRSKLAANPAEPELQATMVFSISAESLPELEDRANAVTALFEPHEYGIFRPTGGQSALLRSMMPGTSAAAVCRDYTQFLLPGDLAAGAPFCGPEVGDPTGLLLGVALDGGGGNPVLLDPTYGPRVGRTASLAAVGALGSGKSFFLKRLCWDTIARGGQIVTIDRTAIGEYVSFAEVVPGKAQVVRLSTDTDVCLDPLRTFTGDDRATVTLGFLSLLGGCSAHSNEGAALAEAVHAVVSRPSAVLSDVIDELQRMGEDEERPDEAARNLARRLAHYRRLGVGRLAFGNGAPVSLDADCIVFWAPNLALPDRDTLVNEHLARQMLPEQILGQALLYLVAAVGRQVVFRDPSRFGAALYDEAWALLASPHGQRLLLEGVRDGRKHNGAIWLASQHPNDLGTGELVDLVGSRFVFRQSGGAVEPALRFLGVAGSEEAEHVLATGLGTGQCLYRDVRERVGLIQVLEPVLEDLRVAFDTTPQTDTAAHGTARKAARALRTGEGRDDLTGPPAVDAATPTVAAPVALPVAEPADAPVAALPDAEPAGALPPASETTPPPPVAPQAPAGEAGLAAAAPPAPAALTWSAALPPSDLVVPGTPVPSDVPPGPAPMPAEPRRRPAVERSAPLDRRTGAGRPAEGPSDPVSAADAPQSEPSPRPAPSDVAAGRPVADEAPAPVQGPSARRAPFSRPAAAPNEAAERDAVAYGNGWTPPEPPDEGAAPPAATAGAAAGDDVGSDRGEPVHASYADDGYDEYGDEDRVGDDDRVGDEDRVGNEDRSGQDAGDDERAAVPPVRTVPPGTPGRELRQAAAASARERARRRRRNPLGDALGRRNR